jgi:NAD(P)-dependent dehydrogenase (short-subunit alcohol dehydrogenase family)
VLRPLQCAPMTNPFSYAGKRVLVTGGSSGIGARLVEVLTGLGVEHVTVLDRVEPPGPANQFLPVDLSDPSAIDAALDQIAEPLDAVFNNAGVAATLPARTVLAVNYLAPRRLSETLGPRIRPGGSITHTGSITGNRWAEHTEPIAELIAVEDWDDALAWVDAHPGLVADPYTFSKEVMQYFTMWSARPSAARGVRINSVCPAAVETPLLVDFKATMSEKVIDWQAREANGRLCTALEVAHALAFLGSDAASYINGLNLIVDGGFGAAMAMGQVDFTGLA